MNDVPAELGDAGRALRSSVVKGLPGDWELDEREEAILHLAARQADDLAALERAIEEYGIVVTGSRGQPVLNSAVTEARQARLAIGRLLGLLSLPDEESEPKTEAGRRAQRAARARWDRRERTAAQRRTIEERVTSGTS